ncbi:MAG: phage/plasmid primase, P4 family [Methanothrix sp.]|nr:phage/plasmid primase, P4 family [Methanothrix sp.]
MAANTSCKSDSTPKILFISGLQRSLLQIDEDQNIESILADKCAKYIESEMHIKTIGKEMYFYENGVYKSAAEDVIRTYLTNMFFNLYNPYGESISNKKMQTEIIYKIQTLSRIKLEDFDKDIFIINMKNGLYNWSKGEFKEHDPEYLSIIQIPVIYDPVATCPNIDKMLEVAARPKDITKLYEFVAYLLYRSYPIQKFLILFGPPNTGKSVFLDILIKFVGTQNKSSVSLQDIVKDKPALVEFFGKLANLCSELSKDMIGNTGIIKSLISNTDPIRARDLYKSSINYINFAKLIFCTNIIPPIEEDIAGFAKRVEIAKFEHVYTKEDYDKNFLDSLTSPEELSGLFNKAIKLLPDLIKRNAFTNQLTTAEAKEMYSERSKPEENFFDKFVSETPGFYCVKVDLYNFYKQYCEKLKISNKNQNLFGRWITKNVSWLEGKSNSGTHVKGKSVAIWPNTTFNEESFDIWKEGNIL